MKSQNNALSKKKIFFITGSRADYGKIKSIAKMSEKKFQNFIFVTGMHMIPKYGNTHSIIGKDFPNSTIIKKTNQSGGETQDIILSNTIVILSKMLKKINPDLVIIHGDRIESLACAISSSVNNYLTAHIEGGELSGTVDEHLRHSISKLSHVHFVSNSDARKKLLRMGEIKKSVHVVGTPDYDLMQEKYLPSLKEIKKRYNIKFLDFAVSIYHPVTTDLAFLKKNIITYLNALVKSKLNYIVIYPNNDPGSDIIVEAINKILGQNKKFRILNSMRFEHFLKTLKSSKFIIGNSSAGIKEAPFFGIPAINVGNRQKNRAKLCNLFDVNHSENQIVKVIESVKSKKYKTNFFFGKGNSFKKIYNILLKKNFWKTPIQKIFYSGD